MPNRALLGLFLICIVSLAWGEDRLRVGSKRFTESYILAEILAQTARPHAPVELRQGLGNTSIVFAALRASSIDLYADYTGTIDQEILGNRTPSSLEELREQLRPLGLGVDVALGFGNSYALAMRADSAERLGIRRVSDLARHSGLKIALSNEFIGRADGWNGLARRYALAHRPTGVDHGLAYDALAAGQVDVIDVYTTDARIERLGLRVLDDDAAYFPRYDAVLLYRLDLPQRFPLAWAAVQRLAGSIDERAMIRMNARAELDAVAFDAIAREHLVRKAGREGPPKEGAPGQGATHEEASREDVASGGGPRTEPAGRFLARLFGPDLARLTLQHLGLVVASIALALALGVPLAVLAAPHPGLRTVVLGTSGLLQTIPSLAMLAVLISVVGRIGAVPALIALTLYALLPIMRNTCTGLAEVPEGLRLAGQALGLSPRQRLRLIELPLAMPTILAGVRTATTITVGTATIAAFIGAGGYGERIVTGLALNDKALLLAGAVPSAAMALLFEGAFELLARRTGRWRTP